MHSRASWYPQQAIEAELATTIQAMDSVTAAIVDLSIPTEIDTGGGDLGPPACC